MIGTRHLFRLGPEHLPDHGYGAHDGQIVEIIDQDEDDDQFSPPQTYTVRAADGWTGRAWLADELHQVEEIQT